MTPERPFNFECIYSASSLYMFDNRDILSIVTFVTREMISARVCHTFVEA